MIVEWDQLREGFQKYWLWQWGLGPFKVIEIIPVRQTPACLGKDVIDGPIYIDFEQGNWLLIELTQPAIQYRDIKQILFHSKWLKELSDG